MFQFEYEKDLTSLTTFGVPATAAIFAEYSSHKELLRISRTSEFIDNEVLHIGGGSNLLFTHRYDGLVLHSKICGIMRYNKDSETVFVIAGAGEKWSDLVDWCVENSLGGLENMAGIPGEVGAAPVQNVGAYGVEAGDVIHRVECFDTVTRETVWFERDECGFAYRDSRFKNEWKGRYIVLRVAFRLVPSDQAQNLTYRQLSELAEHLGRIPTISEVAKEVKALRDKKLPDPAVIGSAGSFFKNPIVSKAWFESEIHPLHPDMPYHEIDKDKVKLYAGWLIQHSGLKGCRRGGAEVYPDNCLVIANRDRAVAGDVVDLAKIVREKVHREMGVLLQPEVNYIDTSITVTILGSGTSKGVPEVGCACEVCRSSFPKDKRLRASALVKTHGLTILIDASPDFRTQALSIGLTDLDAVLLTHQHYDHVGGVDDLRPFCLNGPVNIYLKSDVNTDLHRRLDYCFRPTLYPGVPTFNMHEVEHEPFFIQGVKVVPVIVNHGKLPILGYRIGNFAYLTDVKTIPEEEIDKLQGLEVLVVNALRPKTHFAHMSFDEAIDLINRLKPKEAYLTHFNHEAGFHNDLESRFGPNIHPCYDGLELTLE